MVKNSRHHFPTLVGDKDLAGKCGNSFTVNGNHTIQIVGYTNQGGSYLVKSVNTGKIYAYVFKAREAA